MGNSSSASDIDGICQSGGYVKSNVGVSTEGVINILADFTKPVTVNQPKPGAFSFPLPADRQPSSLASMSVTTSTAPVTPPAPPNKLPLLASTANVQINGAANVFDSNKNTIVSLNYIYFFFIYVIASVLAIIHFKNQTTTKINIPILSSI